MVSIQEWVMMAHVRYTQLLKYLEYITLMDLRGLLQLSNCYPKIGGILGQITIQQFFFAAIFTLQYKRFAL